MYVCLSVCVNTAKIFAVAITVGGTVGTTVGSTVLYSTVPYVPYYEKGMVRPLFPRSETTERFLILTVPVQIGQVFVGTKD